MKGSVTTGVLGVSELLLLLLFEEEEDDDDDDDDENKLFCFPTLSRYERNSEAYRATSVKAAAADEKRSVGVVESVV